MAFLSNFTYSGLHLGSGFTFLCIHNLHFCTGKAEITAEIGFLKVGRGRNQQFSFFQRALRSLLKSKAGIQHAKNLPKIDLFFFSLSFFSCSRSCSGFGDLR